MCCNRLWDLTLTWEETCSLSSLNCITQSKTVYWLDLKELNFYLSPGFLSASVLNEASVRIYQYGNTIHSILEWFELKRIHRACRERKLRAQVCFETEWQNMFRAEAHSIHYWGAYAATEIQCVTEAHIWNSSL